MMSRAEQSNVEQSRVEDSRAELSRSGVGVQVGSGRVEVA